MDCRVKPGNDERIGLGRSLTGAIGTIVPDFSATPATCSPHNWKTSRARCD